MAGERQKAIKAERLVMLREREAAALKSELGTKGWVQGHLVNADGSIGGSRKDAAAATGANGPILSGGIAISVRWDGLARIREMLERAEKVSPAAVARALNRTAEVARTDVTRALVVQTGLRFGVVRGAISIWRASAGSLQAEVKAKGGYTSLKEFSARRTKKGISAAPWGRRQVFDGTFIIRKFGGHVYKREGARRFPIRKLYGPAIPVEMVKGKSRLAFFAAVESELPKRLEHELARTLGG